MCDVCCAGKALDETEAGRVARFSWDPSREPGLLANNPDAPPVNDYTLTPSEWPFVLVQVEVDEGHVEGKGRFRFGFAEDDLGEWIESGWVSIDMDAILRVSWAWPFIDEDIQSELLSRDRAALYARYEETDSEGQDAEA